MGCWLVLVKINLFFSEHLGVFFLLLLEQQAVHLSVAVLIYLVL